MNKMKLLFISMSMILPASLSFASGIYDCNISKMKVGETATAETFGHYFKSFIFDSRDNSSTKEIQFRGLQGVIKNSVDGIEMRLIDKTGGESSFVTYREDTDVLTISLEPAGSITCVASSLLGTLEPTEKLPLQN